MGEHVGQIAIISRHNATVFNVLLQVSSWENMLDRLKSSVDSMLQCSMSYCRLHHGRTCRADCNHQ